MITRNKLDNLVLKYETKAFIQEDPIQFPHRFINPKDIEIAGFIASIFAYGNRKVFIKKLDELFTIMQNEPLNFVENFESKSIQGFYYRFSKDFEIAEIFNILKILYTKDGSLQELFQYGYSQKNDKEHSILTTFKIVIDYFYSNVKNKNVSLGFYHLIPNPHKGGAMKRLNMFLRWMVRKPPVDLGIWEFIPTEELLIPLDVHVARISREMGLLNRTSNDFKAVIELSQNLKQFDAKDPIKYDFAMFGYGVNN